MRIGCNRHDWLIINRNKGNRPRGAGGDTPGIIQSQLGILRKILHRQESYFKFYMLNFEWKPDRIRVSAWKGRHGKPRWKKSRLGKSGKTQQERLA